MTSDRHINVSEMEQNELEAMYNMQNDIGMSSSLEEERVEDQYDWIQKDDVLGQSNAMSEGIERAYGVNLGEENSETNTEHVRCRSDECDATEIINNEHINRLHSAHQEDEVPANGPEQENPHQITPAYAANSRKMACCVLMYSGSLYTGSK